MARDRTGALPAGTVTMLFTDVEGSTRLLHALGADHYRAQLDLHDRLLRTAFTSHGGVEVATQGDSFFVAFPTAIGAIAAAVDGQRALFDARWPHGNPMRVRMGLHTGEPTLAGRQYFGIDVHLAARIMASGHGGQVLASQSTAQLAADAQAQLRDLGVHRLKDIADPQRLYQVLVPGLSADFPPIKSLDNRPTNLPAELTPLVGRRRQRTDLQALLERDDVRLLTLTGAGGVGKTRLSLAAAGDWRDGHAGWTFVVELAPIVDAGLVASTVAETLGLQRAPEESATDVLRRRLADHAALLVLDNFEHILEAGPWCSELLATCPSLRLLVTSRAPLRVSVEHEYPVPPLALPTDAGLAADEAAETEAVELFAERARRVRHGFVLDADTVPVVAEICRRLDGLPLAIELAAARARLLSPRAMLARLQQPLALLESGARDLPARQRTMRATIGWSFQLLPADGQRALAEVAIFAGGCALDAAEAVAHATIDILEGLVEANLLRLGEDRDGEPRFAMLETIRQFGLEALSARGEADVVAARHARFFAELVRRTAGEPYTADVSAGLALLEVEHDNLRGALRWTTAGGDPALGVELAGRLTEFWDVRGHVAEGREWLQATLQVGDLAADADRARALLGSARLALIQDDHAAARKPAQESLELYRKLDDPSGIVRSLPHLAWVHDLAGEHDEALRLCEEAVALAHQRGVPAWEHGRALNFLAMHLLGVGDLDRAAEIERQSLALRRQLGDTRGTVISLSNLSEIALANGDVKSACALSTECLSLSRDLGYSEMLAVSATQLGVVSLVRGDLARAAEHLRTALKEVRQHRRAQVVADAAKATSVLAAQRDNPQDAVRLWAWGTQIAAYAPPYDAVLTRLSSAAAAPLPGAERTDAEATGRSLSEDEAIQLALAVCRAADGT
jgi:predicted ATPase/class 3 adenylate cyclase